MARNIEVKARIAGVEALEPRAAALADQGPFTIAQDDTFFRCPQGRLKLRAFSDSEGELIFYRRADLAGPKESFYLRTATADPVGLRETLTLAWGQAGRVRKQRRLSWRAARAFTWTGSRAWATSSNWRWCWPMEKPRRPVSRKPFA